MRPRIFSALTYALLVVFFVYYALSNLWGHTPQHIDSPLTHGTYLIFYLLLLSSELGLDLPQVLQDKLADNERRFLGAPAHA